MIKSDIIKLVLLHINHTYHELKLTRASITPVQLRNMISNLIIDLDEDNNKVKQLCQMSEKNHPSDLEEFYD